MTADGTPAWGTGRDEDEATFADVRESDRVVDLLAARAVPDTADPLVRALAGWAAVVDAETAAATRPTRRRTAADADLTAALAGGVRPVRAARAPRRGTPWWALSAGAAAVIAAMAVGLGVQDAPPAGPSTVAESVQSIEATLVAARIAAERGDVVGARALIERARELVADLPAEDRARLDAALGATERGVDAVEVAIRRGEPLPAWPDVPGLADAPAPPDVPRPVVPPPVGLPVPTAGTTPPVEPPAAPPAAPPATRPPGQGGRPTTTTTAPPATAPAPDPDPTTTAPPAPAPEPTPTRTRTPGPGTTRTPPPQVPTDPGGGRPADPGKPADPGGGRPAASRQDAAPATPAEPVEVAVLGDAQTDTAGDGSVGASGTDASGGPAGGGTAGDAGAAATGG